jgi:flagellar hook protein FlgE
MIDSITIARSGLRGFEEGLRTISNNTANLNTPGFKGSSTSFADMAFGGQWGGGAGSFGQSGLGLNVLGTSMNFSKGDLQSTGNPLDLAVDGEGYFTLRDANGNLHYTQDGQFKFDADGMLVSIATGEQVMSLDGEGSLVPVSLTNLQTSPAEATTSITFSGNLSSTATSDTISKVTVIDAAGTTHTLSLKFAPVTGSAGSWTVTLMDGTTTVGTSTLVFASGQPVAGSSTLSFSYTPSGGSAMALDLDFSSNVTSFDSGTSSTLAVASQNGLAVGSLNSAGFDDTGTLVLAYSNGKTAKKGQLALAQFRSSDDVQAVGNNEFAAQGGKTWQTGVAGSGQFGSIKSGMVEGSNVDLSQEFSELVIMQRGYQACSQVVSTASDMLTALFGMLSK